MDLLQVVVIIELHTKPIKLVDNHDFVIFEANYYFQSLILFRTDKLCQLHILLYVFSVYILQSCILIL